MAKEIAKYLHPVNQSSSKTEKQFNAEKGYAYQLYKRMISSLSQVLDKASPNFVEGQIRSRVRRDRAFRLTKEQREQLLNAPPSSYITYPEPEPGRSIFIQTFESNSDDFSCPVFVGRTATIDGSSDVE